MSVADKLDAARSSLGGSAINKAIYKATSREVMGPKKKHIDCLLLCTEHENSNLANLAESLFERCRMSNWVIVSKALVTFHNLMSGGNERFLQHMASRTTLWNLENFNDKSAVTGYDMSAFIIRYSNFLTQKTKSYTEMDYDLCRAKRGDDGLLRTSDTPKLLKALVELQSLFDTLLEVDLQSSEFSNGIINSAFVLLYKDMVKLFASYNDGVINVLEKYYEMNKEDCKQSLDIYKKFLSRTDNIKSFLKVAEDVGVNENPIPELKETPSSFVVALENHYQSLEKGQVPPSSNDHPKLEVLYSVPLKSEKINLPVIEAEKEIPSEKDEIPNDYAHKTLLQTALTTEPDAPTPQDCWQTLFEPDNSTPKGTSVSSSSNNNDDLLALHAVFEAQQSPSVTFPPNSGFGQPTGFIIGGGTTGFQPACGFNPTQPSSWGQNVNYTALSSNNNNNPFDTSAVLKPGFDPASQMNSGQVLLPMNRPQPQAQQESDASKGDFHTTLSKVAKSLDNFDFSLPTATGLTGPTGHQWTTAKPKVKTGGSNFQMSTVAGTTLPTSPVSPTSPISPTGSTFPPTRAQPMVRPAYTQPPMFGVQQPMIQPQANMIAQQNVRANNPFGNPVMDNNQALF